MLELQPPVYPDGRATLAALPRASARRAVFVLALAGSTAAAGCQSQRPSATATSVPNPVMVGPVIRLGGPAVPKANKRPEFRVVNDHVVAAFANVFSDDQNGNIEERDSPDLLAKAILRVTRDDTDRGARVDEVNVRGDFWWFLIFFGSRHEVEAKGTLFGVTK